MLQVDKLKEILEKKTEEIVESILISLSKINVTELDIIENFDNMLKESVAKSESEDIKLQVIRFLP